jgi:hypothetical protein
VPFGPAGTSHGICVSLQQCKLEWAFALPSSSPIRRDNADLVSPCYEAPGIVGSYTYTKNVKDWKTTYFSMFKLRMSKRRTRRVLISCA